MCLLISETSSSLNSGCFEDLLKTSTLTGKRKPWTMLRWWRAVRASTRLPRKCWKATGDGRSGMLVLERYISRSLSILKRFSSEYSRARRHTSTSVHSPEIRL